MTDKEEADLVQKLGIAAKSLKVKIYFYCKTRFSDNLNKELNKTGDDISGLFLIRMFARKFSSQWIFLKFLLQSDNELLVSEMHKNWGLPTSFQGFTIKNIEGESTEANELSHIY